MNGRRALSRASLSLAALLASLLACNAIVGVEDVELKRPSTSGRDGAVDEQDADGLADATTPPPRPNRLEVAPGATGEASSAARPREARPTTQIMSGQPAFS